ncbi:hypothetical protein ASD50_22010 [Mesorhizobium sp. Root552]|jgi:hypothetical protein|uniref:hypothetical protein n=1 Tax=Mesorhizobium sp. Root552 TaxID=1736555 RepID=UPI0006FE1C1D|nr:hypothetical protein [Mesorhizobium sp. Root552]KQZ18670.1 hypothetical protein ASD50_22010 [Mesorhizobium sp. Root552]
MSIRQCNSTSLPSPAQVEALTGYGLSSANIAKMLDIDEDVLRAAFEHELDCGGLKANAKVAESLYRKATGEGRESVTAAIFWLKARACWKETSIHEMDGKLDTNVTFVTTYEERPCDRLETKDHDARSTWQQPREM